MAVPAAVEMIRATPPAKKSDFRFTRWRGNAPDHVNEGHRTLLEVLADDRGEGLDVNRLGNVAIATGF